MSSTLTRRQFTVRAAATLSVPYFMCRPARAAGGGPASERVRLGFIGVGNQGANNLKALLPHAVAVCDVDSQRCAAAQAAVAKANGSCAVFHDYRKLLERTDLDAVVITTPDHWHALQTIHACEAGKDVYCEKPLTLTIAEGRAMVKVARRTGRIVQTGSQQRSDDRFRQACELVRNGRLGKIQTIKVGIAGVNFKGPGVPDSEPPAELDYDFWLGPAPRRPYNEKRVHYNFRFFWDYSGGQMTNWGAHHCDIAQWGLGMDDSGPISVEGEARFHAQGWYEVPEWCRLSYRYASGTTMTVEMNARGGTEFIGEKGSVFVTRGKIEATPAELLTQPLTERDTPLYVSKHHHQNWLECLKARKLPICDVELGHRSATVCHLGNIALRTGRRINWDPARERILGDEEAARRVHYAYRGPWKLPAG